MPNVDKHAPGEFCLVELATTDQESAKKFYTQLFSWSASDMPVGPGGIYTMFRIDGREVASAYTLQPEMRGVPPHWDLYITVEDADETVRRAGELGARVIAGPFDVAGYGRMAVLQDPTGAVFCVWQPKQAIGIRLAGDPGTLCWSDLSTPDPARAKKFYEGLLGWKMDPSERDSSGYLHIRNGEEYIGGVLPVAIRDPHTPPHWLAYFLVENVDASVAKARDLGARVYAGPMDIAGVGRYAVLADPQNAVFAIFQPPS